MGNITEPEDVRRGRIFCSGGQFANPASGGRGYFAVRFPRAVTRENHRSAFGLAFEERLRRGRNLCYGFIKLKYQRMKSSPKNIQVTAPKAR